MYLNKLGAISQCRSHEFKKYGKKVSKVLLSDTYLTLFEHIFSIAGPTLCKSTNRLSKFPWLPEINPKQYHEETCMECSAFTIGREGVEREGAALHSHPPPARVEKCGCSRL